MRPYSNRHRCLHSRAWSSCNLHWVGVPLECSIGIAAFRSSYCTKGWKMHERTPKRIRISLRDWRCQSRPETNRPPMCTHWRCRRCPPGCTSFRAHRRTLTRRTSRSCFPRSRQSRKGMRRCWRSWSKHSRRRRPEPTRKRTKQERVLSWALLRPIETEIPCCGHDASNHLHGLHSFARELAICLLRSINLRGCASKEIEC